MASVVTVGCRLPHGLIIHLKDKPSARVELLGQNKCLIKTPSGTEFGLTYVETDFWNKWKSENKDSAILNSGAVFEAKTDKEAADHVKEVYKDKKTGLEPMQPDSMGVSPADKA